MLKPFSSFHEITAERPDFDAVAAEYERLHTGLTERSRTRRRETLTEWDALQRRLSTWTSLSRLRFHQDTQNPAYVAERDLCDEMGPRFQELEVDLKRRLLEQPLRGAAAEFLNPHLFALWQSDIASFDPRIQPQLVSESRLCAEFTALLAAARIEFQGREHQLNELNQYRTVGDRDVRLGAEQARWGFFAENQGELDRIFDELVRVRHEMATTLGFENYIPLGYLRMQRVDYDQNDVERFREQVRAQLVPLAVARREAQRQRLGLDALFWWDEGVQAPGGGPRPQGDAAWIVEQCRTAFAEIHPDLGQFINMMADGEFLDLMPRPGKAGGGFCTSFDEYGVPFVFANFSQSAGDVRVFLHEMGHAFQCWSARDAESAELVWPTFEAAEMHSMGLEFLAYPQIDALMGEGADQYRREHLEGALLFIPYGVAVDHFQHEVYANPTATPAARHKMWRQMEEMYVPWRRFGPLEHPAMGGFWQVQRHIYASPFYYIDYTLAQTCALQFWAKSRTDRPAAIEAYVNLCRRGGRAAFQTLVSGAGLVSPFAPGCLERVTAQARAEL
jgi:M3 family oligoendopeptidase